MESEASTRNLLERMVVDASAEPRDLPLSVLKEITNNFSDDQQVGRGGFAIVYKGRLQNGVVAVKKLSQTLEMHEKKFNQEVACLMRVRHKNIVRFLGYCADTQGKLWNYEGKIVMADIRQRLLCFDFMPNGSLDRYITDASRGLEWSTRYKLIRGICEGLCYLHHEMNIVHLDLKPANILLDYNMVPKIADFGLSRCFDEKQSQAITSRLVGSLGYLAPEFYGGVITQKLDIYSLGVIIMEILTGKKGYFMIDNVCKSWSNMLKTSQQADTQLEQVRVCCEIGLECIDSNPAKRPTAKCVTERLHEMESRCGFVESDFRTSPITHAEIVSTELQVTAESSSEMTVAKIGLWGGVGGHGYLDIEVVPNRLESWTICSGAVIFSLAFSYTDHRGQQHTAGPWGGNGPEKGGRYNTIHLGPSEHLRDVSGTTGQFHRRLWNNFIITSLTFTTNARTYGPYGEASGTPFQIPVQSSGSIVGFFARAGWYLDSFGVYVNPKQYAGKEEDVLAKIGPWGGNGGSPWDIKVEPKHLKSLIIHSGIVVESVEFSYVGENGQKHTAGPWGGPGGSNCTIQLGPSEFLTAVYGTMGQFADAPSDVVTSLTFVSNAHIYGPFGRGGGVPFQIPMQGNGSILGFFGRAGKLIDAIGVYANPQEEAMQSKTGLTKIGPWGGTGGTAHYVDDDELEPKPHHLESMTIHYDHVIHSLEFSYSDLFGRQHIVGPWGRSGGKRLSFPLNPSEYVQDISGTFGRIGTSPNVVITSLSFGTNQGHVYGPIGYGVGVPFNIRTEKDDCIVGFFGRAGCYLEAIGAYIRTY